MKKRRKIKQLIRPFKEPSGKQLDELVNIAYEIAPGNICKFAKILKISVDNYYKLFDKPEFNVVRLMIEEGETKRYQKEYTTYQNYHNRYRHDQPLLLKNEQTGKVTHIVITPFIYRAVERQWILFQALYDKYSEYERYKKKIKAEVNQDNKIDSYESLRQSILETQDRILKLPVRQNNDFSYTPEHYLIDFEKPVVPIDKNELEINETPKLINPKKKKEKVKIIIPDEVIKNSKKLSF